MISYKTQFTDESIGESSHSSSSSTSSRSRSRSRSRRRSGSQTESEGSPYKTSSKKRRTSNSERSSPERHHYEEENHNRLSVTNSMVINQSQTSLVSYDAGDEDEEDEFARGNC